MNSAASRLLLAISDDDEKAFESCCRGVSDLWFSPYSIAHYVVTNRASKVARAVLSVRPAPFTPAPSNV